MVGRGGGEYKLEEIRRWGEEEGRRVVERVGKVYQSSSPILQHIQENPFRPPLPFPP